MRRKLQLWDFEADEDTPLNRVPEKSLLSWADVDRTERYPLVAGLVRLFGRDHAPAPIMLHLIDGVKERGPVLAAMSGNLGPSGGVVSELVATHDSRAKGIESLFALSSPEVVDWARRMAVNLRTTADGWRRDLEDRNERFE